MDDYRGGKFIVGSDLRSDEQRRAANEYFRNQNEAQRVTSEGGRNNAASNALGIANNHSRSNFLTQIGLFSAVVLTIIILATIAILAYEKSNDRKGLVDINNLRDLTLSNLDVNDTTDLNTLSLTGETTSTKGATFEGGLSVSGTVDFDGGMIIDDGVSIGGGLSVGTTSNLYGDVHAYQGVSIDGGLSVNSTSNLYGEVVAYQGLSIYNDLTVSNDSKLHGDVITYQGVSVIGGLSVNSTSNLYGEVHAYQGVSIDGGLSVGTNINFSAGHGNKIFFGQGDLGIANKDDTDLVLFADATNGEILFADGHRNGNVKMNVNMAAGGVAIGYNVHTTTPPTSGLLVEGGVSINSGLSVNSISNLYGDVHAYQGVSVDTGLSVNSISNLYGEVHAYQGVSVDTGLSVNSTSNLYGEVHAYQGVSIDGGLSVGTNINLSAGHGNKIFFGQSDLGIANKDDTDLVLFADANGEILFADGSRNGNVKMNVNMATGGVVIGNNVHSTTPPTSGLRVEGGNIHLNGGGIVKKVTLDTSGAATITAAQLIAGFAYSGAAGGSVALTFPGADAVQTALAAMGVTSAAGTMLSPIPVFVSDVNNLTVTAGTGETVRGTSAINNKTAIIYYVFTGAAAADIIVVGNA